MKLFLFEIALAVQRTQVSIAPQGNDPSVILKNIYSAILSIAGIIAFASIILGGYRIIVSQGDSGAVEQGKKTVLTAIVGFIIIMLFKLILNMVYGCALASFGLTCIK